MRGFFSAYATGRVIFCGCRQLIARRFETEGAGSERELSYHDVGEVSLLAFRNAVRGFVFASKLNRGLAHYEPCLSMGSSQMEEKLILDWLHVGSKRTGTAPSNHFPGIANYQAARTRLLG